MTEQHYFPAFDVLALIEYECREGMNLLSYWTHRQLEITERILIETFILQGIARQKTKFYESTPASFCYFGVNSNLTLRLETVRHQVAMQKIKERDVDIDGSVKRVVASAMERYYAEQIGDKLRSGSHDGLDQLVEAYNIHAEKKITVESLKK